MEWFGPKANDRVQGSPIKGIVKMEKEIKTSTGFIFKDIGDKDNYAIFHEKEQSGNKLLGWISRKTVEYEVAKNGKKD